MLIVETVPLDATDAERDAITAEIAATYSDLQDAGLDPVILAVESHSGGTTFAIEVGDDEDPRAST